MEEGLTRMQELFPQEDERVLLSFLSSKNDKLDEAIAQYQEVKKWREEIGPVGIKEVEKHLRSEAYMVTLEYPGCEKQQHPPIIFLNGMIRGKRDEMVKQVIYCVERAWANMPPGPPRVKFIVNTRNKSFRIPDSDYRAAIFNIMRQHYPFLINCKVIFIDVPSIIAAGLTAVGRVFDKVMTDRFQLATSSGWTEADDDVKSYAEHVPPANALRWSADRVMSFDVESLIAMRREMEADKLLTWDGEGGIMGSTTFFPTLPTPSAEEVPKVVAKAGSVEEEQGAMVKEGGDLAASDSISLAPLAST